MIPSCIGVTEMSDQHKDTKSLLLAGIIAAGVFAGAFGSIQLLNVNAQTTNQTNSENDGTQPVVTSMDDVNCPDEESAVHCVDLISTQHFSSTSTVSTSGNAVTKVQPDKFTVTVGVETNGTTAEEAASTNAELTAQVIAALKALGISEDDISTSSYSVYPVYTSNEPVNVCRVMEGYPIPPECYVSQEITGYKASNSVSITLDANGEVDAGKVIDTAIEAGANTVQGAYFFISQERQQEIQDGLISEAIDNARHRADIAADAVGMEVIGVKSISLNDVYFPIFAKEVSLAAGDTQILPGQQEVSMTVSVVYFMGDGSTGTSEGNDSDFDSMAIARSFILSKLPGLGIEIDDELDLHTDMVVHISDTEFHLDYGVVDTEGGVHDGHIEVVNGEVTVAILDGQSIL